MNVQSLMLILETTTLTRVSRVSAVTFLKDDDDDDEGLSSFKLSDGEHEGAQSRKSFKWSRKTSESSHLVHKSV